jgi:hypothetical protein
MFPLSQTMDTPPRRPRGKLLMTSELTLQLWLDLTDKIRCMEVSTTLQLIAVTVVPFLT